MEDFFSVEPEPTELDEMDEFDFTDDTENEAPLLPRGATLHLLKLPDLQVGDIVLSTTNMPESIAIRAATSSDASHSAIYIGHGDVIESIMKGVSRTGLREKLVSDSVAAVYRLRTPLTDEQAKRMRKWLLDKAVARTKYDFSQPFRALFDVAGGDDARFYCSELVLRAYEIAGRPLSNTTQRTPGSLITLDRDPLRYVGHLKIVGATKLQELRGDSLEAIDADELDDFDREDALPRITNYNDALALCGDAQARRSFYEQLLKAKDYAQKFLKSGDEVGALLSLAGTIVKTLVVEMSMSATYEQRLAYIVGASYGFVTFARKADRARIDRAPPRLLKDDRDAWSKGFNSAYTGGLNLRAQVDFAKMKPSDAVNLVYALFIVEAFCERGGGEWTSAKDLAGTLPWPPR